MKSIKSIFYFLIFIAAACLFFYVWPETKLPENIKADRLIVYKSKRTLEFWAKEKRVKTYKISLGGNPVGHKQHEGDSKTPEGLYYINDKNPKSNFHLNLGISYPNETDRSKSQNPGGDIKIHGLKNGNGFIGKFQRAIDWTNSCISVTNEEIEELYKSVPIGTPIQIYP